MKDTFLFGPFHLDPGERTLRKNGSVVPLGSRALDMLVAMVEYDGKVLTPAELMAVAWPGLIVEASNVRVQIAKLRNTLGCGRDGARYIANVAGRGYCFVAPIRRLESVELLASGTSGPDAASETSRPAAEVQAPRSLSTFPLPLDGAIGREECVAELAQIVTTGRLTTVVGAAGAGKTTLAVLVAHAIGSFEGAMLFVDLSIVDRDDMVVEALASAIGYMPSTGDLLSGLLEVLSARRTLIVLDNCEHVIAATAALCSQIVQGTRNVSILNTSREALRVKDEFVYLLPPLASPPHTGRLTAQQAMVWPAIQLFMERAREGGARGALSDDDAPIVAALCHQLDGNPHAIGLVASRVGAYGMQGVADLFSSQFALHWRGRRDDNPRQQTVETLIDWSHNLLPERDRQVLYRLSVFSGAFPLEAAVAVTADDAVDAFQVREAVGDLVDKSLVAISVENGETHIRLLETTRAYATARLAKVPAGHRFSRRHALYYADQLRKLSESSVTSRARSAQLPTLEVGNIRTAIEWAFSAGHDPALATRMWCMAAPFFLELGLVRECGRTCERTIKELPDQFKSTQSELRLLDLTAITYFAGADYDAAMKQVLERGLELSRQLGDTRSKLHFLAGLHLRMITNGEFQDSLIICEQYSSSAVTSGGTAELAIAGWMTGSSKHYTGDLVGADADFAVSARLVAQHELRPLHYFEVMEEIIASINTARVKWALGMPTQALQLASDVIRAGHSLPGSLAMRVTLCFHILLSHGLHEQAKDLIEDLENLSIDYNTSVRRQVINVVKGFLLSHQGQNEAAIDHLQQCLALLPPPKMSVVRTDALQALAESQRSSGNAKGALDSINEAIDLSEDTQGKFNFPDLLRTRAEVLMSLPEVAPEEVEAALSEAENCARKQGALIWELRVALTVARVHASQGKKKEAREALERVYSRFTEGFDTSDLRAAAQALRSM
ncbi:MAG TPA: winged helix-turn-helix domain-containing protein [Rhodocyclaceae bacterium]|nr:winged helix-turn-helix domain-containing protein [Rhodocyclaceae bacterium]